MRKYILAFILTIPILLLVWNMVDSAEEPEISHDSSVEKDEGYQAGILQKTDDNEAVMPEKTEENKQEEAIDNTQMNMDKFYQYAEEVCGLSHKEAQSWFDIITEDDIFDGGVREISDLIFDDIDNNGKTDMVIMVEYLYGRGALYFYMNEEEPYCFTDEDYCFYFPMNICYADLNGDGKVEIALALQGTGAGAVGDWHKAVFSYTGSTMERLEIPSDLDKDYDDGIKVDVIMEPEPDTYTAYCPYFDESITFQASNVYEGDKQKEYLAQAPLKVGGNVRGYFGLQIVTWEGRNALQVSEYLSGEGGTGHFVGWVDFILVWDEQGCGSVADWWVEGNTWNKDGLIFYSYE